MANLWDDIDNPNKIVTGPQITNETALSKVRNLEEYAKGLNAQNGDKIMETDKTIDFESLISGYESKKGPEPLLINPEKPPEEASFEVFKNRPEVILGQRKSGGDENTLEAMYAFAEAYEKPLVDFFSNPRVKEKIERAEDPEEMAAFYHNVYALAKATDMSPEFIHERYEKIANTFFGEGGSEAERAKSMGTAYTVGKESVELGLLQTKKINDTLTEEEEARLKELKFLPTPFDIDYKDFPRAIGQAVAKNIPNMLHSLKGYIDVPRKQIERLFEEKDYETLANRHLEFSDLATDPFSVATNVLSSFFAGPAQNSSDMMTGLFYTRVKEIENDAGEEIDDSIAIPMSRIVGSLGGLSEHAEILTLFLGAPLARAVGKTVFPKVAAALAGKNLITRTASKGATFMGAAVLGEEGQEFFQLGLELLGVEMSKAISPNHKAFDGSSMTRDELIDEVKATAIETFYVSAALSFMPAVRTSLGYNSTVKTEARAAVRDAINKARTEDGFSVKEVNDTLMENEFIQLLSDKKIGKLLEAGEQGATLINDLKVDPENIDTNLSELYQAEVDVEYEKYIASDENKKVTKDEFQREYLAAMGRNVPPNVYTDEQIANMYAARRSEWVQRKKDGTLQEGEILPTVAQYKDSVRRSADIYAELSSQNRGIKTLSQMEDAYASLERFSLELPTENKAVVSTMLKDMRESLDAARQAISGLEKVDEEGITYTGPVEYTTRDVMLVTDAKISAIQEHILKLKADKKAKYVNPQDVAEANRKIAELEERIVDLERKKQNINVLLKKQYANMQNTKKYMDVAMERAARINMLIGAREEPGYQAFLRRDGARIAMSELNEARGEDGVIDLTKVPLELIRFLEMDEYNVELFTGDHAAYVWNRAMAAASVDQKKQIAIGRAEKAYQNEQQRRVDSLFKQINRPMNNLSEERQAQIKTIRKMLDVRTIKDIDFDAITTAVRAATTGIGRRVANPEAKNLYAQLGSFVENLSAAQELEMFESFWKEDIIKEKFLEFLKNDNYLSGIQEWAKNDIKEYVKTIEDLKVPDDNDDYGWSSFGDKVIDITSIYLGKFSVQNMTNEAFQKQINDIISKYEYEGEAGVTVKKSIEALESAKQAIDYIRYVGQLEMEAASDNINSQARYASNRINEKLQYDKGNFTLGDDPNKASEAKSLRKGASGIFKHPAAFFRELGGKEVDAIFRVDKLDTRNEELKQIGRRAEKIDSVMRELKIKQGDLSQRIDVFGRKVQVQELMGVYVGLKDPKMAEAIYQAGKWIQDAPATPESFLTKGQIKLANEITQDLLSAWERESTVNAAITGEPLGRNLSYIPMIRELSGYEKMGSEIRDSIYFGSDKKDSGVSKEFTKQRLDPDEIAEGPSHTANLKLNLFDLWTDALHKQEHFIAAGEQVAIMKKALEHSKESIESNVGRHVYQQARAYVQDYANPAGLSGHTIFDKMLRVARGNVTFSHLAAALPIIARQGLSGPLYMMYVKPSNYFAATGWFYKNPAKAFRWMKEVAPAVIQSGTGFDLVNTRVGDAVGAKALKRKMQDLGMSGITLADRITKTIGFRAVYDQDVGIVGERQAIKNALAVTDLTQPTSDRTALPGIYRTNTAIDWIIMYTQQPMKILNMMTYEMGQKAMDIKTDKNALGNMVCGSMAILFSMSAIWILKNRRLPETPEDVMSIVLNGTVGNLPGFGRYIVSGAEGGYMGPSGAFDAFTGVGKLLSDAPAKDKIEAAFFDVLPAVTGVVPGNAIQNVLDYIETGAIGEIILGGEWEE